jgi:hypothetical protein
MFSTASKPLLRELGLGNSRPRITPTPYCVDRTSQTARCKTFILPGVYDRPNMWCQWKHMTLIAPRTGKVWQDERVYLCLQLM